MNKTLLFTALLLSGSFSYAQQGDGGLPVTTSNKYISPVIDSRTFATPDIESLRAEDALIDHKGIAPWRFGSHNYTYLSMSNSGTWTNLANGGKIWRLKLVCENALTVNLLLDHVVIPEGNELYVYNEDKSFILGNFTANHLYDGELGTELVPGSAAIVEYYIPAENANEAYGLNIHSVVHGYRTASEFNEKAFGSSGNCNMNVNCTDGEPWVNQRNSAVMLVTGGSGFCSGALVNNTQNDGKPYVLTANHCFNSTPNVASWVFRFNWQAADCADPQSSPSFTSLSGGVLRSRRTPSDFCLVEITGGLSNGTVPQSYNPYLSGWDNSGTAPSSTVCIHHPAGDIKKISFDDAAAFASQEMGSSEANSTWTVEWDRNTTTEGGSSGSPLFDQNHRIIGQLWGGGASCSSLSAPDYYGRVATSWNPPGSNQANQLKFWLDPTNSGATVIDGFDPYGTPLVNDAGLGTLSGADGVSCTSSITPEVTITNGGSQTLTSATITYGYDGGNTQTFPWTGSLAQFASAVVALPAITPPGGAHTFEVTVSAPNGVADENAGNNTVSSSFTTIPNGFNLDLVLNLDCYGNEIDWTLKNAANTVLYSSDDYSNDDAGEVINEEFCVAGGCFTFTINDEYGDGLSNSDEDCAVQNGSYILTNDGTTLAGLTAAQADFDFSNSQTFCLSGVGLDENAASNWMLFPNPVEDYLNIDLTALAGTKSVTITSPAGQLVRMIESADAIVAVDVRGLAKGVYIVQVNSRDGMSARPFVVK